MTPLTFSQCAGDVMWNGGGGHLIVVTPRMTETLIDDITQAGIDGALFNDIDQVRQATQLLNQLNVAMRAARLWRQAAQVNAQ